MRQCDKFQLSNSTDWFLFCSCAQRYIKHVPIGAAAVFLLETCWIASVWDTGFTVDWSLCTDRPPFCFGESGYVWKGMQAHF